MRKLKVFYEGIDIKPDDVIIVRPKEIVDIETLKELHRVTRLAFKGHKVLVLSPDVTFSVYDKKTVLEFLDQIRRNIEGRNTE